jgi:hypothetical protein
MIKLHAKRLTVIFEFFKNLSTGFNAICFQTFYESFEKTVKVKKNSFNVNLFAHDMPPQASASYLALFVIN